VKNGTMDIPHEVNHILHSHFEIAHSRLTPDTQMYADLDLDSLDAADLLALLEKRTEVRIQPEALLEARTLQDVYNVVASQIDRPATDTESVDQMRDEPGEIGTAAPNDRQDR
jgi:acyl carrier protein